MIQFSTCTTVDVEQQIIQIEAKKQDKEIMQLHDPPLAIQDTP